MLALPVSAASAPLARGCKDYRSVYRIMVGVNLRAQYHNAVREIVENPAEFGSFFSLMDSARYRDTEACLSEEILQRHKNKTLSEIMVITENESGFYEYNPDDHGFEDRHQLEEVVLTKQLPDIREEVSFYFDTDETKTLNIKSILSRSYIDENCAAIAQGYLICQHNESVNERDLLNACSIHSEILTEFAYYATQQNGGASEIFRGNQGLFLLHRWETAKPHRGKRVGASLLKTTLRSITERSPQAKTIVVELEPKQYPDHQITRRINKLALRHENDSRKLREYWDSIKLLDDSMSNFERTLHLNTREQPFANQAGTDLLSGDFLWRGPGKSLH